MGPGNITKYIFSFRTMRYIVGTLLIGLCYGLYVGFTQYPYWWNACIYDGRCIEKEMVNSGVQDALAGTADFIFYEIQSAFSSLVFLGVLALIAYSFGFRIWVDRKVLQHRKDFINRNKAIISHRAFLPSVLTVLFLFGVYRSYRSVANYHQHELKTEDQAKEVDEIWDRHPEKASEARRKNEVEQVNSIFLTQNSFYGNISAVYYVEPKLKDSLYDNNKYFNFTVKGLAIRKEMTDAERLELFFQRVVELKQIFNFSGTTSNRAYMIEQAIMVLNKDRQEDLIQELNKVSRDLELRTERGISEKYQGQQFIVAKGTFAESTFSPLNHYLRIKSNSPESPLPRDTSTYLLEVKKVKTRMPILTLDAKILAVWKGKY